MEIPEFFNFFKHGPFLKSLLNLLQYRFCCLCFGFFVHEAFESLHPQLANHRWNTSPAFEGEVLTSGPQGKSPDKSFDSAPYCDPASLPP